jgi:hypothetical protein
MVSWYHGIMVIELTINRRIRAAPSILCLYGTSATQHIEYYTNESTAQR